MISTLRIAARCRPIIPGNSLRLAPWIYSGRSRGLRTTVSSHSALDDVNIFADEGLPPVAVKTISSSGIELVDGLVLPSACIFLEGRVFLWDVPRIIDHGNWEGWTRDHFKIFEVVVPKPEILLLGTGNSAMMPPPSLKMHLTEIGIQLDVMNTWNACSTYNLLTEEGRRVAAALIPPRHVPWQVPLKP